MIQDLAGARVGFLICGTQKGGTTALDAYLRRHHQIQLAVKKEVHFFDKDEFFSGPQLDYGWYHSHFHDAAGKVLRGESTPIYMYWKAAAERIYHYNPLIKIIILLRNPIERAYSHWNMEFRRGNEDLSFYDALISEADRCVSPEGKQHRIYSYVDRGFYTKQITRLRAYFPDSNILILKSDFLLHQPSECLHSICAFLKVSPLEDTSEVCAHSLPYSQQMEARERLYLSSVFTKEIHLLEQMLNWDCNSWINF